MGRESTQRSAKWVYNIVLVDIILTWCACPADDRLEYSGHDRLTWLSCGRFGMGFLRDLGLLMKK